MNLVRNPVNTIMLTPMEVFILALLKGGVDTMYALAMKADLSPGGIRPIVARLENNRLIRRTPQGKRKKRVMQTTNKGQRALAAAFTGSTENTASWDLDSALRVLWSSLEFSKEARVRLLDRVVNQRKERAADLESTATRLSPKRSDSLSAYHWMRALCKARQLRAEAEAIDEIGAQIEPAWIRPGVAGVATGRVGDQRDTVEADASTMAKSQVGPGLNPESNSLRKPRGWRL
jgi:DNA-binding PadR family transcriptional regulator